MNPIALQARGPNLRPARNRAAAQQSANAMLEGRMNQLKFNQAQQELERETEIRNALAESPNAGFDDIASIYRQHGDIAGAMQMEDRAASRQKESLSLTKEQADIFSKQLDILGRVAPTIQGPEDYERAVYRMFEAGVIGADRARQLFGEGYNPERIQQWQEQALQVKDRLAQEFQQDQFTETKRHNRAVEANQPLVEVYDEGSPTGTRMVTRGDATNMPGKPPSNMSVTSPDGTTIQFGRSGGALPKGAETQFAKDIVGNQQALDGINQTLALYEPEFLTYGGAAKGAAATVMNKLDPEKRSQFQSRRSAFISSANRQFLTFRKWATGVAGGEKEMAEIKRATFSEDDSPQDFEAKIGLARSLYRRLNARSKAALEAGVNNEHEFRNFIHAHPLESIPTIQERGDQLHSQGYDDQQVLELLSQEGYL